jgi:hypothetical protein
MKFIIIIITLVVAYFLIKITKKTKEKVNKTNNVILCKECGYHVPMNKICHSLSEVANCKNKI